MPTQLDSSDDHSGRLASDILDNINYWLIVINHRSVFNLPPVFHPKFEISSHTHAHTTHVDSLAT